MGKVRAVMGVFQQGGVSRIVRLMVLRLRNLRPSWFYTVAGVEQVTSPGQMRCLYLAQQPKWSEQTKMHPPRVATLFSTYRPDRLRPTIDALAAQRGVGLQAIIATHGFTPTDADRNYASALGLDPLWLVFDDALSLGEVYNAILEEADAPYLAKIDDDDWYGPHYLLDSIMQLQCSGAGITGKNSHFVYAQDRDAVYLRLAHKHHRFVYSVAGATIVTYTRIAKELGFVSETVGEDQDFLGRAFDMGIPIYSSSPFGYAVYRGSNNTWTADGLFNDAAVLVHEGEPGKFECVCELEESRG